MKSVADLEMENEVFNKKTETAFKDLFKAAKQKNEVHYALSFNPEFRGQRDPGWSATAETFRAFDEYLDFIEHSEASRFKVRVALSFYCHLSEASGFYEIPKNMLRVVEGQRYILNPFHHLAKEHKTGSIIAPNTNKIFQDLVGTAQELGFSNLAEVFRDAFSPKLRNAYAHADYVIWDDGIRLPKKSGGGVERITWEEFDYLLFRGLNFFKLLRAVIRESREEYNCPKTIIGKLADEPERQITIHNDQQRGVFIISFEGS